MISIKKLDEKNLNKLTMKAIQTIKQLKVLWENYMYFDSEIKILLIFHSFSKNELYRNWIFDNIEELSKNKNKVKEITKKISNLCENNINGIIQDEYFKNELFQILTTI